jgi:hypothetical protein
MHKLKSPAMAAAIAVAMSAMVAGPAVAATAPIPGNQTGGDVSSGPIVRSADAAAQSADKAALAKAWNRSRVGTMQTSTTESAGGEYETLLAAYNQRWGTDLAATSAGAGSNRINKTGSGDASLAMAATSASTSYESVELVINHTGQSKDFYCGPASGRMILHYLGDTTSAYNGAALGQGALATSAHMNTDAAGATTWSSDRFRIGLNRWSEGTSTGFYVSSASPSGADFKDFLIYDIDNASHPLGADTVEIANGAHYNNHPKTKTIGHWIVAYKFYEYGDKVSFADPSTTLWGASYGVQERFSGTTATFATNYLQNNGVTW